MGEWAGAVNQIIALGGRSRLLLAVAHAHWRRRFAANRDTLQSLYDERFCRMFEFYLVGSELAFRRMGHMNWQLQLTRSVDALPLSRDYMYEADHQPMPADIRAQLA